MEPEASAAMRFMFRRGLANVKKIRTRLGLSQESFAQTYGFALSAVRDWEQGRRQPERSARILLRVVEKEPDAVTRALAKSA